MKMKVKIVAAVLSLLVFCLLGCDPVGTIQDSGKITGIYNDEINCNSSKHVGCFVLDPKTGEYIHRDYHPFSVKRIPDLQPGERAWIRCQKYRVDGNRFLGGTLEIHCHPENLNADPKTGKDLKILMLINIILPK